MRKGHEAKRATNYDVVKTLQPDQLAKITSVARCLACARGGCVDTTYKLDCITGFQAWLKQEADADNWKQIIDIIS